jgi:hypothetical protein
MLVARGTVALVLMSVISGCVPRGGGTDLSGGAGRLLVSLLTLPREREPREKPSYVATTTAISLRRALGVESIDVTSEGTLLTIDTRPDQPKICTGTKWSERLVVIRDFLSRNGITHARCRWQGQTVRRIRIPAN